MDQRQLLLLQRTQRSYEGAVTRTRDTLDAFVTSRWNAMQSWRPADMVVYENQVVPVLLAAERQVAGLTNQYLTSMSNIANSENERPAPLPLDEVTGPALRNGVEPSEVYRRPGTTVSARLAKGATMTAAVTDGLTRARTAASMDLQLARTHTVRRQGKSPWYRRTLSGSENCSLCVIASTQRYRRGNLMPIHPHCDCGVVEERSQDPGQVIDPDLLGAIHGAVIELTGWSDPGARYLDGRKSIKLRGGSTRAADYTDLIVVREHGEYGPVLAWRDQKFTTQADLAA